MLCNLSEDLLKSEFHRIKDDCYLDHTGSALYTKSQVEAISKDLCENLYGNPHSNNLSGKLTCDTIDQVRYRILQHFNTDVNEYTVIFTSGATQALKIVAETFDFTGVNTASYKKEHKLDDKYVDKDYNYTGKLGEFVYTQDNHTSVLGMRSTDNISKVQCRCFTHDEVFQVFLQKDEAVTIEEQYNGNSLFVYPGQCNFSGVKYPLRWIQDVHDGALGKDRVSRWFCMLDAATYVATSQLDLTAVKPDFVCLSFYKMFGLPTGIGALIVHNSSAYTLHKKYYGGGTVEVALPARRCHTLRQNLYERFEDGTLNFLSILAINHGFDSLQKLGLTMNMISLHCFTMAQYLHRKLISLHHSNGRRAVKVFCDSDYSDPSTQGGVVNFNMVRSDGSYIGYMEIVHIANLHNIYLRTGCFCNPGACLRHLGLTEEQYYSNFQAGHVCGDDRDLVNGKPTGSVRVSFGYYTTYKHLDTLIDMLTYSFVSKPVVYKVPDGWEVEACKLRRKFEPFVDKACTISTSFSEIKTKDNDGDIENTLVVEAEREQSTVVDIQTCLKPTREINPGLVLSHIFIYPIKSCGSYAVPEDWSLDDRGLAFDRLWMIVTSTGVALTQKQEPKLCLVKPVVDLKRRVLELTCKASPSCTIPLDIDSRAPTIQSSLCQSKVCNDYIQGYDCGDSVAEWLSQVVRKPGLRLIRQSDDEVRSTKKNQGSEDRLSLSNQAQFLLVSETSVTWLADQVQDINQCKRNSMLDRFRSNFVVQGVNTAFEEQDWAEVHIGNNKFKVIGPCGRCQMICINQTTGERTREPLTTLSAALKGRLKFGIYLSQFDGFNNSKVSIGDNIKTITSSSIGS